MSVQADPNVTAARSRPAAYEEEDRGMGWMIFAGTMLAILGTLNVIGGIAAIDNSHFYVRDVKYVFGDLNTWGWIVLITGAAQVLTAFGIWARSSLAAWVGIGFAGLNAMAQLLNIPSYPLYSVSLFAIDILVIYALAVHGGRSR
jgi:hypothetical protein